MRTWIGTIGLAALLAGSAHAGVLGPTKASQLVNLFAKPGETGTLPFCNRPAFDTQRAADGPPQPFDIPAGQVLVVTGLEWSSYNGPPSGPARATVLIDYDIGGFPACSNLLSPSSATTDSTGYASGSMTFPTGIAVKSGGHLGLWMENGTLLHATLYGYLAKDR